LLDEIEERVPRDLEVHLVWDNYATHKTAVIRDWERASDPDEQSWLNQGERFFALLTENRSVAGVHRSVEELEAEINAFLDQHNAEPKSFRWVKSADDILASVERFCTYNTSPT
jgi:hypothetical protein